MPVINYVNKSESQLQNYDTGNRTSPRKPTLTPCMPKR